MATKWPFSRLLRGGRKLGKFVRNAFSDLREALR